MNYNDAQIAWNNTKEKLSQIHDLYSFDETFKLLKTDNYYKELSGKSKNRTLIKANPKLYKSIYMHSTPLEKVMINQKSYYGHYNFPNRIKFIVERLGDIENIKCKCGNRYTFNKYCRVCSEPKLTINCGRKHSKESIRKMRISAIGNIENRAGQVYPAYNLNSIPIIEAKAKELGITDIQHAENGGEFHIKELGYWVDGYSKEKNIVIEYDEKHHFNVNGTLKEKDIRRQLEIEKFLNCEFVRVKWN